MDILLGSQFDLYAFSESWLKKCHNISTMFGYWLKHFDVIRCDRSRLKGGGVILFIRNCFSHAVVLSESVEDGYEILAVDLFSKGSSFRFVVVYRTPSCSVFNNQNLLKPSVTL